MIDPTKKSPNEALECACALFKEEQSEKKGGKRSKKLKGGLDLFQLRRRGNKKRDSGDLTKPVGRPEKQRERKRRKNRKIKQKKKRKKRSHCFQL